MKTKTELLAELEQAQKRIAELEKAAENKISFENRFTALFRSNPIPVGFTRASDFRIVDVNDAWSALTGYTREEALGHTSTELGLAKPQTLQHVRDMLHDQGEIRQNEILLYTRAGKERRVLISSEPIEIDGEAYFLNNLLDVTEQRLAENKLRESETVYKTLFESNPHPMWVYDLQSLAFLTVNEAAIQHYGYSRDEFLSMTLLDIRPPEDSQRLLENVAAVTEGLDEAGIWRHVKKDGSVINVEITSHTLDYYGHKAEIVLAHDVTMRMQAEEKIKAEQFRFNQVAATVPGAITLFHQAINGQMGISYTNEVFEDIFGLKLTENNPVEIIVSRIPPEDLQRVLSQVQEMSVRLQPIHMEFRYRHPLKGDVWLENRARPAKEADGSIVWYGLTTDITERKKAEEKLRESEEVFRAFIDQSHDGIMLSDEQGKIIEWNPALAQISGLERNQTLGMNAWDVQFQMMTPEKRSQITVEQLKTAMLNVMKEEHHPKFNSPGEFEFQTLQGERKFLAQTSFPIFSAAGYRLGAIVRDITARKQAEEKLRESEARFATAFFTNPAPQSILSFITGQALEVNESTCRLFGYSREELIGAKPGSLNLWAEPAEQLAALEELQTSGHLLPKVVTIRKKSGETRSIIFTAEPIIWKEEPCLITSSLDITERKEAEQKVLASETLLRQVMESTQDSIFAIDLDYCLLLNNQRHQQVLVETGGHPFHVGESVLPPNYPQDVIEQWRKLYDRAFNGEEFKWENEWPYKDGQWHVIESNFSPLRDAAGNITGALVVIHDITEHKRSENMLERARNTLEQAQKIAHMGSFEYIAATQTTVWSEEESRIYGLDPTDPSPAYEEMLQKMIHPDDAAVLHDVFTKAMQTNSVYELEHRIVQPDGSIRWVHDRAVPYLNEKGQLERYIGITLDITERKKAEQTLLETEERLALVMEGSQLGYWDWNIETGEVYRNARWAEMLGYTLEEIRLNVKQWTDLHHPDDKEAAWKSIQDHLDGKTSAHRIEYRMRAKDGQYKWILDQARVVKRDPNGKPLRMSGTHTDITERKQAEEIILINNQKLELLFELLPVGLAVLDREGKIAKQNTALEKILRISAEGLAHGDYRHRKYLRSDGTSMPSEEFASARVSRGEPAMSIETGIVIEDGTTIWTNVSATRVPLEDWYTVVITSDITERKQADVYLRESEQRFATIFENSPVAIGISRLSDGQIVQANSAFFNLYGFTHEEVIGSSTLKLGVWADPADRQRFVEMLKVHQYVADFEVTARRKSGEERQVLVWGEWIEIAGEPYMMAQMVDITERKLAERKLRESEENYRGLMESLDSVIATIDYKGKFLYMNDIAAKVLGDTPENLIGKTMGELFPEPVATQQLEGVRWVIREGMGRVSENITFVHGEARWFRNSIQPIHNENGQVVYALLNSTDIHELKSTQQELSELNRTLEERIKNATAEIQDLYDNAPAGYHSLDANGCFLRINQTELNWLGYSRDEVIGRPFSNFVTGKGLATFKENFPIFKQRGWLQDVEIEFLRKDRSTFYVSVNAIAIKDENGSYLMSRSTVFDITARKRAEQALRESEANLQNFLDTAHDLIQSLDEHGNFLYVNNAWCATLGYTLEEALHLNMFDVIAPEHHAACREMLKQLVVGEEPERVEVIFKTKQGQAVIVEGHVNSRKNANGQIATNGIFRDITARKQADEALKASETKYRQLFENMNEGFSLQEIITDENGEPVDFRYLDANGLFEHHSGIAPQVVIGRTAREVFPQVDPRSIQNFGRVALTGEPIALEYFSTTINRYMSVRAFSPKHGQFATIFEDITERKQAEEKLNESYARLDFANRELERASRAKDEFLANMSHELRTPLNAIIGLSDSMLEISANDLTPKHQKYLNTIRESGQHLLNLINDILDLAKVGAGQLVLEPHPVDVNTICQASLRMVKQLAENKNLNVHFEIDHDVDSINSDERRLKQMLVNLLSNAVKFTPPAGTIGLEVRGDRTNKQVRFTVWDTGIGISKEDQAHLFQPFMQVNSSLAREVGGTGLGLVLVSEMARLHGGTVSLESEPGKGSRFSFTLPWYDQPTKAVSPDTTMSTSKLTAPSTSASDKKQTILLVEDTETAAMVTRDYLEAKGYLVEAAKNGRDGIALAEKIKPDLILMDVQMPVMDGLEAMRRLRAQVEFQNTPIIALTAYAMEEDRERCLAAGATDYISKPYELRSLVKKIKELLEAKYKKRPPSQNPTV